MLTHAEKEKGSPVIDGKSEDDKNRYSCVDITGIKSVLNDVVVAG